MELIRVDAKLCKGDGICMAVCPNKCLAADAEGRPVAVAPEACIGCGHCVAVCPHGALDNLRAPLSGCLPAPAKRPDFAAVAGLMETRRSVRAFKAETVPRETLERLLDLIRFAPTACHTQHLSYIMVSDPQHLHALAAGTAEMVRGIVGGRRYAELWDKGEDVILRKAPHLLVALGDKKIRAGVVDASIALTYAELAAAALGLGACWAGLVYRALNQRPELAAGIGVPAGRTVCGALMLGRPKYRYRLVPPRKPTDVTWL